MIVLIFNTMHPVEKFLKNMIHINGSIAFAEFIEIAMYHKEFGYYIIKNPIGKNSDYITAPSITSLFGETIAIWILSNLESIKKDFIIVELGPGTGIMMNDILNIIKKFPQIYERISVHLIEISPTLKKEQQKNLHNHIDKISWHSYFDEIPEKTIILIANEFFDALPIHQYQYVNGAWYENKVTMQDDNFKIIQTKTNCKFLEEITNDSIIERCTLGKNISEKIISHIEKYGGKAAIIDYGYTKNTYRNTIQAVKNHKYCDIFKNIGAADITHEVDFGYLFPNAKVITQEEFLLTYGIKERAELLMKKLDAIGRDNLFATLERLLNKNYMGELFKCALI